MAMDTDDVDDSPQAIQRLEWRVKVAVFVVGVMIVGAFLVIWFNILVNRYEVLLNREIVSNSATLPVTPWQHDMVEAVGELKHHAAQLDRHEKELDEHTLRLDEHTQRLDQQWAECEWRLKALETAAAHKRR